MDHSKMRKRLETACRHVGEGEEIIAKQQALIAALKVQGREINAAVQLLYQLEELVRLRAEDRDYLERLTITTTHATGPKVGVP
jgi:hypothetical protein